MRDAILLPALCEGVDVLAGDPSMRTGYSNLADAWVTVALNQIAPKDDAGKPVVNRVFSDSDKKLIVNSMLEQCDAELPFFLYFSPKQPFQPRTLCISEASQGLPQLRGRMGGYFFLFSIIRYFYGNGRSLFDRQALCAALVLLFAAVVSL